MPKYEQQGMINRHLSNKFKLNDKNLQQIFEIYPYALTKGEI